MNFLYPVALLALCGAMAAPLMADEQTPELTGCAAKRQGIINQIELAKSRGNQDQQAGLETALAEVTTHCTDASLRKAMKKGDAEKINKRKDKLAASRKELQEAVDELDK
jgi:hypothetical protein